MKTYLFFLWLIYLTGFNSCAQVKDKAYGQMLNQLLERDVPELSVAQAKGICSAIYLDAREDVEYEVSHIKNAKHVGYDQFNINQLTGLNPLDTIIVYCAVGYRSEKISKLLLENGYPHAFILYGGIFEWVNAGLPVFNENGLVKKVHPYNKAWGIWLKKEYRSYK